MEYIHQYLPPTESYEVLEEGRIRLYHTFVEKIASRVTNSKGSFTTSKAELHRLHLEPQKESLVAADRVELSMRLSEASHCAVKVVKMKNVDGIKVREVIAEVRKFMQEQGSPDGKYTVVATEWDIEVDWAAVYAPYKGPEQWNGRPRDPQKSPPPEWCKLPLLG